MGLIAMQKVESSNLFSRFARDLALGRDFVAYGGVHPLMLFIDTRLLRLPNGRLVASLLRPHWGVL